MATGTIQKNMVKLWENSSPSSDFAAQDVNIDLSKYSLIVILFLFTKNDRWVVPPVVISPSSGQDTFRANTTDNVNAPLSRSGTVSATKVHFDGGYYGGTNNAMMIPYQIWGIKA